MKAAFHNLDVRLAMEPGRWLVGPAGVLLASVVLVKQTPPEPFIVLDAAMNDLVRPSMYDAWHGIVPVSAADAVAAARPCSVVGPVCESGDTFARSRCLPALAPNARVAILDAGAYGAVMSSTYNARPLAAEVWVDNGRWSVIRERQPIEALWERERFRHDRPARPDAAPRRAASSGARRAILFEALWPAFWPPLAVDRRFPLCGAAGLAAAAAGLAACGAARAGGLALPGLLSVACAACGCRTTARPTGGWRPAPA